MATVVQWKIGMRLKELERQIIVQTLIFFGGNRSHAAKSLGVSRGTVLNKILEHDIVLPCLGNMNDDEEDDSCAGEGSLA